MKKRKIDLVKSWFEKAKRDLITAKNILNSPDPFSDIICFHAQQAVEKYIKAYLVFQEIEFPKTHTLEDLILLASQKDPSFLEFKDLLSELTPYAVEIRYPEFSEPSLSDAEEAVQIAMKFRDFVSQKLNL